MTTIFTIIPVHNRVKVTEKCLDSLFSQENRNCKVIVVDDGSTDGTSAMISKKFPSVVLLHGDGNLWWTGAINKGINYVIENCHINDYVLLLNDDLTIPSNYIENLLILAAKHPRTIIGSVIVDSKDKDTILSGGIRINWKTAKRHNLDVGKKLSSFNKEHHHTVSTLTGRGTLIHASAFREFGIYNETHYKHYGDTELPKRAEKFGYKLIVSYKAIVYSDPLKINNISSDGGYKITDIKNYYWNTRSNTDLRVRFWFAYDTSPNFFMGTIYWIFDFIRITYHFFTRIRLG
jgi:N-acetylglucosaminyl-diphospho-decaprenol L-rhamnosyltransferase